MISATLLSGCGEKQVPIYRGMSWANPNVSSKIGAGYSPRRVRLLSGASDDTSKHGLYYGDYVGSDVTVDEDDPYNDGNSVLDAIDRKIRGIFGDDTIVIKPDQPNFDDVVSYSDAFLNILIYNPDNFEIVSFTLNGEQYSGDMFEDGSNMENIVVKPKVTATASGGFFASFEISDIKYRDGDEIKDVIIGGSTTIGTGRGDVPTATVSNMSLADGTLSFDVNLNDSSSTIVKGEMLAVLYDGKSIVASQDVFVGDNSVTFEGLRPNTLYQCAVGGYYYNNSSEGGQLKLLYSHAFYTDPVVLLDNVSIAEEAISFDYLRCEGATAQITSLRLYRDDICEAMPDVRCRYPFSPCGGILRNTAQKAPIN